MLCTALLPQLDESTIELENTTAQPFEYEVLTPRFIEIVRGRAGAIEPKVPITCSICTITETKL